jgi:hypothetical protein
MIKEHQTIPPTEDTKVQIGHKDGKVIMNMFGTSEVEPSFIVWSPLQARQLAKDLLRCANEVEKKLWSY